jgi:NAD(P)-dependent dehydrogenase (short-subunit alcohol dehydrogenase family)
MTQTVVITGASAGIGRATARHGERGANVGLIARGQAGLDGAVRNVEDAGGKTLAIPADVSDFAQVRHAARQVEEFFGPIAAARGLGRARHGRADARREHAAVLLGALPAAAAPAAGAPDLPARGRRPRRAVRRRTPIARSADERASHPTAA